jgi:L-threonylcarbamoyladenylate synthase
MLNANFDVKPFLSALVQGKVCLHPTDTLPGLTFDPSHSQAYQKISEIKDRDAAKNFIGLVPDQESAESYWAKLPNNWQRFLRLAWPGPLSVIWNADSSAPKTLTSWQGTICLRVPSFIDDYAWMTKVLAGVSHPVPTTSVNLSGDPAITTWDLASAFARRQGIFVPECSVSVSVNAGNRPSTILQIIDRDKYLVVREGAVSGPQIQGWFDAVQK